MAQRDLMDRLSAKRQFVLVLRVVVEASGEVSGELVDPLSNQKQRFAGLERLVDAVRVWIHDALGRAAQDTEQPAE
jgi:hypothetical protein